MKLVIQLLLVMLMCVSFQTHATDNTDGSIASAKLDLNSATVDELARQLPGIGPKKARRVVSWRKEHGPFTHIEQLQEVKGIGPKTVSKLRPLVRIGSAASARQSQLRALEQEQKTTLAIRRIFDAAAAQAAVSAPPAPAWYAQTARQWLSGH